MAETETETEGGAAAAEEAGEQSPPLPGEGTPEGEKLAAAHAAFERGDYARVRELCDELREAPRDDVALAARELRKRTEVDPVQVGVVLACLVLFGIIAYTYVF